MTIIPIKQDEQDELDAMLAYGATQEEIDSKRIEFESIHNTKEKRVAWALRLAEEEAAKPAQTPQMVTSAQFKCAVGETRFAEIEVVLAAIPDATTKFEYTQYWLNTTEFELGHPMILAMQSLLGWSDEDRNQIFIDAGKK